MRIKVVALALAFTGSAVASEEGFYFGGKVRYGSINSEVKSSTLTVDSFGNQGAIYGAFAGYNFPVGRNMYVGLEAEYFKNNIEAKYRINAFEEEVKFNGELGVSLILGHGFSDNLNVYGRVGMSKAKVEGETSDNDKDNDSINGWHGGFGVEFKNDSPMTLRAEYRYTQYKEIDFNYGSSGVENKPKAHSVSLSAVYNF